MTPAIAFAAWFAATLVALVVVVWSGVRARRRVHVPAVVVTIVLLVVTIVHAYRLGDVLDLESAGRITPIHLGIARAATAALLLPVVLGIRTLFVPRTRRLHGRTAWLAVGLVVLAAITGVIMVALASPR